MSQDSNQVLPTLHHVKIIVLRVKKKAHTHQTKKGEKKVIVTTHHSFVLNFFFLSNAILCLWNWGGCALHRRWLEDMVVVPFLLEKLGEMVFAVQYSLKCRIVRRGYCAATVWTLETWLVISQALYRHLQSLGSALVCKFVVFWNIYFSGTLILS